MQKLESSDFSGSDLNCVALYKIGGIYDIELPSPDVHLYIADLIERISHLDIETIEQYVVYSMDELEVVVDKYRFDEQPNAVPYLTAKNSGDFFYNFNALMTTEKDIVMASRCYDVASRFSARMGKQAEADIYSDLSFNADVYIDFLSVYYNHLRMHQDFEITDEDLLSFREYVIELARKDEVKIHLPKGFFVRNDDDLLM